MMNVYKHMMLGIEKGIERETAELFHQMCMSGSPEMSAIGVKAAGQLRLIKRAAIRLRELADEEERNANEISRAEESHVRGGVRQGQYRYSPQGSEGVRRSGSPWEVTEVRPQIEKKEQVDGKIDYKGPESA